MSVKEDQNSTDNYFRGESETSQLLRNYDWEAHPLGHPSRWPKSFLNNLNLLLNSSFPMFIWWSKALYAFHNDAYIPALGRKHPAAIGKPAREVWQEIWHDLEGLVNQILLEGKPIYAHSLQLFLERKNFAEETFWTFSYSPAFDDDGEVNGIFCACFEVTDTVLGERRLKTLKDISEATFQTQSLESVGERISQIIHQNQNDVPANLIYLLNMAGTEANLLSQSGITFSDWAAATIKLTKPKSPWPLAEVKNSRQPRIIPLPEILSTKTAINEVAIYPIISSGQDNLVGFLITGISPQLEYDQDYKGFHSLLAGHIGNTIASVQTREELARQQAYLRDVFEQAPAGICIMRGPEFIIDLANPGICKIWGRNQAEVLNKPILEALPEIAGQGIIELLEGVLTTGIPYINTELAVKLELEGQLQTVYVSFVYHPIRDAQNNITGVIAVAIGIDEQVAARKAVEEMNKELLTINADLDNFVYAASHDLKAPISNIESLMHALVEELPANALEYDIIQKLINLMQDSVERFKKTVTDLTEIARTQRETSEDIGLLNIADVLEAVTLDLQPLINQTGAQIETDFAPQTQVNFSAKNLRSIIYNLFSNALKYHSPDRPALIRISTERIPEYIVLTVTDNGLGMDLAEEDKIFTMFKRFHDHVEGSGVGLYIVKKIVENAGGKIEVESKEGQGATFKVYFKL